MKSKARGFVWLPSLDKDNKEKVKHCGSCQRTRHTPPQVHGAIDHQNLIIHEVPSNFLLLTPLLFRYLIHNYEH